VKIIKIMEEITGVVLMTEGKYPGKTIILYTMCLCAWMTWNHKNE
jgi:hypothetical protein